MKHKERACIPIIVETDRILLRPLTSDDCSSLLEAATESHDGLNAFYGGALSRRDLQVEQVQCYIADCDKEFREKTFIQYGLFDKATGRLIGAGSLHHLDWSVPKGRIGYWIRKSAEGRGYATDAANILTRIAFDQLGFHRLEIRCATNNKASAAIPTRLGYSFVALFERNKVDNSGNLVDLEIYARFNEADLPPLIVNYKAVEAVRGTSKSKHPHC